MFSIQHQVMLTLKIKRISPTHHTLEYIREDGTGEVKSFESKSVLLHDFMHLAIEREANLEHGFFGLLDQGYTYDELNNKAPSDFPKDQGMEVEMVVGPFTGIVKGTIAPEQLMAGLRNWFEADGRRLPSWASAEFFERAHERYKSILGEWNSLKFGETLETIF